MEDIVYRKSRGIDLQDSNHRIYFNGRFDNNVGFQCKKARTTVGAPCSQKNPTETNESIILLTPIQLEFS